MPGSHADGAEPFVAVSVDDPGFLAYAIGAYGSCPERGDRIGTTEELDRLRSGWAKAGP